MALLKKKMGKVGFEKFYSTKIYITLNSGHEKSDWRLPALKIGN